MSQAVHFAHLPTEQNNPFSRRLDQLSTLEILRLMNKEDQTVPRAVKAQLAPMNKAVELIVSSLTAGGRLHFMGAGTSGRLGILEAAECPPTFNTAPSLIQAHMAGGKRSVFRSEEGAEDKEGSASQIIRSRFRRGDALVGIAASGVTPFVRRALTEARRKKGRTILVTGNGTIPPNTAEVIIAARTGPEVIAGSTRLKAATAAKLILNSLVVTSMVALGKVYRNWMVDLQPKSRKLRARALRLVSELGHLSPKEARNFLRASGGNAKRAILMAQRDLSRAEAKRRLKKANGHLRRALEEA